MHHPGSYSGLGGVLALGLLNRRIEFVRTSKNLLHWSGSVKVAYGGCAGNGPYSAECPSVYYHKASG